MNKEDELDKTEASLYGSYKFHSTQKPNLDRVIQLLCRKSKKGEYSLEELRQRCQKLPKTNELQRNPTRGYVSLLSYLKEQNEYLNNISKGYRSPRNKTKYYNNSGKSKTELKEVNKNSFRTTKVMKEVGLWDKDSEDAFRNSVINELNRLTKNNIDDVVHDVNKLVRKDEQINYFVDSLVQKASVEQSFSELYAIFASKIKMKKLKDKIIQIASETFQKLCVGETELHKANGCSKFISSLINLKVISYDAGFKFLKMMIEKLQGRVVSEQHVEMLNSFLLVSNESFIKSIPNDFWDTFFSIFKRELPSRIHFLMNDIEEVYSKYISGITIKKQEFKEPQISDQNIKIVRNSFVNYAEGEEAYCKLNCKSFLEAVFKMFPDHLNDSYLFIEFVCEVLSQITQKSDDLSKILSDNFKYCRNNKIETDFLDIWCVFDDFLCMLLIKDLITINEHKRICKYFPKEHSDNINNAIKWFIYDHFEFYKSIITKSIQSQEIKDALAMPSIIENTFQPNLKMSRLIAVSIIRSILFKISEDTNPLQSISKYKDYLSYTYEKQMDVFIDEFQVALQNYDYGFSFDDIQNLLKK